MATSQRDAEQETTAGPLWLEILLNDEQWTFELGIDTDAAIVVGSHPSAQVQIARPGVAATHFHFERERNGLFVVPGYRAGLRVNAAKVSEPVALTERGVIDSAVGSFVKKHVLRFTFTRGSPSTRSSVTNDGRRLDCRSCRGRGDSRGRARARYRERF